MGLSEAARVQVADLIAIDSGQEYEGYWEERWPLRAYLRPDPPLIELLARRAVVADQLEALETEITTAAERRFAAGDFAYQEYEQAELSSSGPVLFLALRDAQGVSVPESLWAECEMELAADGHCPCEGLACRPGCAAGCLESPDQP
jgi:hypothetical protein